MPRPQTFRDLATMIGLRSLMCGAMVLPSRGFYFQKLGHVHTGPWQQIQVKKQDPVVRQFNTRSLVNTRACRLVFVLSKCSASMGSTGNKCVHPACLSALRLEADEVQAPGPQSKTRSGELEPASSRKRLPKTQAYAKYSGPSPCNSDAKAASLLGGSGCCSQASQPSRNLPSTFQRRSQ